MRSYCLIFLCKLFRNSETAILLYSAYVRSNLEYACQVWNPQYNVYIDRLEAVQKRLVRTLLYRDGLSRIILEYSDALNHYNLLPLRVRRDVLDQVFLYRVMNNFIDCGTLRGMVGVCVPRVASRRGAIQLHVAQCRTNSYYNSFLNRSCRRYNERMCGIDMFGDTLPGFRRAARLRLAAE